VCIVAALVLVWQGVPQTLGPSVAATTLDGAHQVLARGPVASQEAIKLLSGDGGGFFNANSAHPFENPTALAGLIEMLLIFLIGVALTNTFGRLVGDQRQGWALFAVMAVLFLAAAFAIYPAKRRAIPLWQRPASRIRLRFSKPATWKARRSALA
jgi:K+-transporting ATPase ATPase A chain